MRERADADKIKGAPSNLGQDLVFRIALIWHAYWWILIDRFYGETYKRKLNFDRFRNFDEFITINAYAAFKKLWCKIGREFLFAGYTGIGCVIADTMMLMEKN